MKTITTIVCSFGTPMTNKTIAYRCREIQNSTYICNIKRMSKLLSPSPPLTPQEIRNVLLDVEHGVSTWWRSLLFKRTEIQALNWLWQGMHLKGNATLFKSSHAMYAPQDSSINTCKPLLTTEFGITLIIHSTLVLTHTPSSACYDN